MRMSLQCAARLARVDWYGRGRGASHCNEYNLCVACSVAPANRAYGCISGVKADNQSDEEEPPQCSNF
jgi:hypothetical protein